jgi:tetratricopeptide (TPR) repeat protein
MQPSGAQKWKREKADAFYEQMNYNKALPLYENLWKKDAEVYRRLAKIYATRMEYEKAVSVYEEMVFAGDYKAEDLYNYAYYSAIIGDYMKARELMRQYVKMNPGDIRAKRFLEDPSSWEKLQKPEFKVVVKPVSINGEFSEFGAVFYNDSTVVYTASRKSGRVWTGNYQPYLDLYAADLTDNFDLINERKFLPGLVNKKYHDGPATFNAYGDLMIVTRNVYGKRTRDFKIWLYELNRNDKGNWSKPKPLPFNSLEYSCGHASLNAEGTVMYFASDMPGGYGKSDIYVAFRDYMGNWSKPVNLGPGVNTEADEKFPFYDDKNGLLFFASDRLGGLGGLDIYVTKVDKNYSRAGKPQNLGAPINSSFDDFSISYKQGEGRGFFASNRPGGKGYDDIYAC